MLTKSNTELTETTIKLTKIIADLTGQLKRAQGNTPSGGRLKKKKQNSHCANCKVDVFHKPGDCFELVNNIAKHLSA